MNSVDGGRNVTHTQSQRIEKNIHNQHILIIPDAWKYSKKYMKWATDLQLTSIPKSNEEENYHLVGLFNFESIGQYNRTRQKVHIDQLRSLHKHCKIL